MMTDTANLVREMYATDTDTNRTVETVIKDADLACRPKGIWSVIIAFFGG